MAPTSPILSPTRSFKPVVVYHESERLQIGNRKMETHKMRIANILNENVQIWSEKEKIKDNDHTDQLKAATHTNKGFQRVYYNDHDQKQITDKDNKEINDDSLINMLPSTSTSSTSSDSSTNSNDNDDDDENDRHHHLPPSTPHPLTITPLEPKTDITPPPLYNQTGRRRRSTLVDASFVYQYHHNLTISSPTSPSSPPPPSTVLPSIHHPTHPHPSMYSPPYSPSTATPPPYHHHQHHHHRHSIDYYDTRRSSLSYDSSSFLPKQQQQHPDPSIETISPSPSTSPTATPTATTPIANNNNVSVNGLKKRRRGNLPKNITEFLKDWLLAHKKHPYPTEKQKLELAHITGLAVNQISNWFINARRRILQPLLESEQLMAQQQQQQQSHSTTLSSFSDSDHPYMNRTPSSHLQQQSLSLEEKKKRQLYIYAYHGFTGKLYRINV
ncbi:hypothetical protein BJ944DRAFT_266139 [Cunninghamella echinulata]|nr:hypothetical protein BJ944DRAFT_266139 [Cunninghamella echinulata]